MKTYPKTACNTIILRFLAQDELKCKHIILEFLQMCKVMLTPWSVLHNGSCEYTPCVMQNFLIFWCSKLSNLHEWPLNCYLRAGLQWLWCVQKNIVWVIFISYSIREPSMGVMHQSSESTVTKFNVLEPRPCHHPVSSVAFAHTRLWRNLIWKTNWYHSQN